MSARKWFASVAFLFASVGLALAQNPKTDPKKTDPKQAAPKQADPKKTDPKKADPKKQEPKKQEPKKQEPKKQEPKKQEPKKQDPKKDEPKKAEPKKDEPKKDDPKQPELKDPGPRPPAPTEPHTPLDLVRGLREAGMADLAVEYLRELDARSLSETDRRAIPLERARCLLEAAEEEPDEGTRTSMVGEAKEAFADFLAKDPTHPRAAEASLALARLTSIEAKAQLNRAKRVEVPPEPANDDPNRAEKNKEREEALARQREEAKKAQPLFLLASQRFAEAAKQMKVRLDDKTLPPYARWNLSREAFDAELAAAINQHNLADTVVAANTAATQQRVDYLEKARAGFEKLAQGPPTNRTVWVARAWMAETLVDQGKPNEGAAEFDAIQKSGLAEAEDGKRMVQFFQARRAYLDVFRGKSSSADLERVERQLRAWLDRYGRGRKPTPEVVAARYYRAYALQTLAQAGVVVPRDGRPPVLGGTARAQLDLAERIYRELSQTDNDYTARAARNRMAVVRLLLGEADKPADSYATFESAQMASLIQIAKLSDAERALATATARRNELARAGGKPVALVGAELRRLKAEADVPRRRQRVLALLERARELAGPQENPADVTDNLLRLVYFYQAAGQPYQAAVLGEHVARTVKSTGGKSAAAGLLAVTGYMTAAAEIEVDRRDPSRIDEAEAAAAEWRRIDRARAVELARHLDKAYPNDPATDAARHRLAALLAQERQLDQAFEAVTKVRAGYARLNDARNLEGYIAAQLITAAAKDTPLPAGGKAAVFRRAADDLSRVVRPAPGADADDARGFLSVRARLGMLYLAQSRADPEAEKKQPGYDRALAVADEIAAAVPTFEALLAPGGAARKELNLDGQELRLLALDLKARALFLRARALVDGGPEKFAAAAAALQPVVAEVSKTGALLDDRMKQWAGGRGDLIDPKGPDTEENRDGPDVAAQKAKIAGLVAGVDRVRCDTVMLGFKLAVRQGKTDEAAKMLELLKKAGGSVADNQTAYEHTARELAAPIPALRRDKKDAEAKALGAGVTLLLKELRGVPNLSPSSTLFIGQTLYAVEEHEAALEEFKKIKAPSRADWATVELEKIENGQERNKLRDEIRDYRFAQLYTARALRGAGKVAEAEKLLTAAIGTGEARGYAFASYDFRRDLALTYEAKAAATSDVKEATAVWGQALREWTTLFQFAQARVKNLPADAPRDQVRAAKSAFFDAYYEIQRVMVAANSHLQKNRPDLLTKSLEAAGKKIADMETSNKLAEQEAAGQGVVTPEVWGRFHELLERNPAVKNAYKANGGKLFLERPAE
jgi:hypothetical protein